MAPSSLSLWRRNAHRNSHSLTLPPVHSPYALMRQVLSQTHTCLYSLKCSPECLTATLQPLRPLKSHLNICGWWFIINRLCATTTVIAVWNAPAGMWYTWLVLLRWTGQGDWGGAFVNAPIKQWEHGCNWMGSMDIYSLHSWFINLCLFSTERGTSEVEQESFPSWKKSINHLWFHLC